MATQAEDELVAQAFKADKHEDLARAIEKLSPDEALFFVEKLEAAIRKRKIQLMGYLAAMFVWLLGMVGALIWYGTHDGFVGYVFIVPFGFVGVTLWAFGKWSERIAASPPPPDVRVITQKAAAKG